MRAVALRNRSDKTTVAYLSGGLDSRVAVAALLELETRIHTFNFALPGTQDYVLGNEFAREAHTIHEALPKEQGDLTPDYSALMARAWESSKHRAASPAERPSLIWSGEGGSVAFGHVHLCREIVEQMRRSERDAQAAANGSER
jgi:asparagine synthetase B (glutamine-hydrolysing)